MKIYKKELNKNSNLLNKLAVPTIFLALIVAACGGADVVAENPVEVEEKDVLLEKYVFSNVNFQPEVNSHKVAVKDCFRNVSVDTLLEGVSSSENVFDVEEDATEAIQDTEATPTEDSEKSSRNRSVTIQRDNLVAAQNVFLNLAKCKDFEEMNLGEYKLFKSYIKNESCRKSILWEKYHASRISLRFSGLAVSATEAEVFGKETAHCTGVVEQSLKSNEELFPWFDWSCLESLYGEEHEQDIAVEVFEEYVLPSELRISTEDLVDSFIRCIDFDIVTEFLEQDTTVLNDSEEFIGCVRQQAETAKFIEAVNEYEDRRLTYLPSSLSKILSSCFYA